MDRDLIIQEIKRLADRDGGVAPGRAKFARETGVRESDWSGRHWARWSDAVREAGCSPNALNAATPREEMLKQFALFMRRLQRIPTAPDLRMERRQNPHFPGATTFQRLASKSELITQVRTFCCERTEFADILPLFPECESQPNPANGKSLREESLGFVYLIKSGKFHKIGKSNAAGRRERELAIQLPERVKTVHVIRTDDPPGIERYWHERFAAKRKNGEWFELDADDIRAFKRRRFM